MNTLRRFIASVLSIGIFAPVTIPAYAFTDVSSKTSYQTAIEALEEDGVLEGYADGTFKPDQKINRAEFLKIILESRGDVGSRQNCFPDVKEQWYAKYVCQALGEDIVVGYPDGTFKPEKNITFVEAGKILTLAYKQVLNGYFTEWYESYARALESANAIPTSITKLDHELTRGEMAEMMWRLRNDITTEDSKGYLNVKYPEVKVNLAADTPQTATSCADLRAFSEEAQAASGGRGVMLRDEDVGGAPTAPTMGPVPAAESGDKVQNGAGGGDGNDYSETNVQVEGVDEGDIIKTDGTHVFVISEQKLRIAKVVPGNAMKEVATMDFQKENFSPTDLYVDGDTLVVIGNEWSGWGGGVYPMMDSRMAIWPGPWYNTQETVVRMYDISNPTKPTQTRKVAFEGYGVSSRKIEDKLYLVINQNVRYWGGPMPLVKAVEEDVMPQMEDSAEGEARPVADCDKVTILPHVPNPAYLTVAVVPTNSKTAKVHTAVVLGSAENIYASLNNLYVATTEWIYDWTKSDGSGEQKTNLYRFEFEDDGISMKAQGSVPGRILNQFSMDEHDNSFRIATTEDNWNGTNPVSSNNLYVTNMELDQVGAIEDIAPGEQIYSVRFMGDRTYMVTFKTVDPFFVIDTSNPRNPKILGKLKIPGYSNYLHPYDENHIIGFGKDAEVAKEGTFAWYQGMKVALFDVSDVSDPTLVDEIAIGDRGTDSPLLWNHKALLFDKARNLLAFPVRVHKISDAAKEQSEPGMAYGDPIFQGAHVYDITLKGFKKRGEITHYTEEDMKKAGSYFYGKDIERIIRIGNSLVTFSMAGLQSHTLNDVKKEGSLTFGAKATVGSGDTPNEPTNSCPSKDTAKYVSTDADTCKSLLFSCEDGMKPFFSECGCGCQPE